jgi:hypothetical protein
MPATATAMAPGSSVSVPADQGQDPDKHERREPDQPEDPVRHGFSIALTGHGQQMTKPMIAMTARISSQDTVRAP